MRPDSKLKCNTWRSVLKKNYTLRSPSRGANLEHIIIDGGSSDNFVKIIKKYEPWLAYRVSEKDRGQSYAIDKGFDLATGELLGWLNFDDSLAFGRPTAFY